MNVGGSSQNEARRHTLESIHIFRSCNSRLFLQSNFEKFVVCYTFSHSLKSPCFMLACENVLRMQRLSSYRTTLTKNLLLTGCEINDVPVMRRQFARLTSVSVECVSTSRVPNAIMPLIISSANASERFTLEMVAAAHFAMKETRNLQDAS